eukprot:SAG31_NODE_1428_length_8391_cov_4.335866_5_plen_82_part_00
MWSLGAVSHYNLVSAILSCDILANSAGQHVDGNFVTVLWADGPGLQVPAPSAQLSCDQVKAAGELMQRRQQPTGRAAPSFP